MMPLFVRSRIVGPLVHVVIGPCDWMRARMLDWLERKAARPVLIRMHLHMRMCPPCQRYLAKYLQGVDYAKASLEDSPPPEGAEQTIELVRKRAAGGSASNRP